MTDYPPSYEIKMRIRFGELDRALSVLMRRPNMNPNKLASHHITALVAGYAANNFVPDSKDQIEGVSAFFQEHSRTHPDCATMLAGMYYHGSCTLL